MDYSIIVTIVYAVLYSVTFIATSIYAVYGLLHNQDQIQSRKGNYRTITIDLDENNETNHLKHSSECKNGSLSELNGIIEQRAEYSDDEDTAKCGCKTFLKEWGKSVWQKNQIYIALIPHIMDQATDLGVILEYYRKWQQYDHVTNHKVVNPMWLLFISIFIVLFQRIISTATMYLMTYSITDAALQFVDLLMVKAIWVNYSCGLNEPGNPQRFIALLEGVFESFPQAILSMGYILKSNLEGQSVSAIVVFSTVFSIWSLSSKVASDDKLIFKEDNRPHYCCIAAFWRLPEIFSRVCFCVFIWILAGGIALIIILSVELLVLFYISISAKTLETMKNIMYLSWAGSRQHIKLFHRYRVISFHISMLIICILTWHHLDYEGVNHPYNVLVVLFLFTWMTGICWPLTVCFLYFEAIDPHRRCTGRDLPSYMIAEQYDEIKQLLKFGVPIPDNFDMVYSALDKCPDDIDFVMACYKATNKQTDRFAENRTDELFNLAVKRYCADFVKYLMDIDSGTLTPKQNQNFKEFIVGLSYCYRMIIGEFDDIKINKKHVCIMKHLINHSLNRETTKTFTECIYTTFAAFNKHKYCFLDLDGLYNSTDKKMRDLIMYPMDQEFSSFCTKRHDEDVANLFRAELFAIFPNIKKLRIKTTSFNCFAGFAEIYSYSLNIRMLASLVGCCGLEMIIIVATTHGSNWINDIWNDDNETIQKLYNTKNYSISMQKTKVPLYGTTGNVLKCTFEIKSKNLETE
eukprot:450687_1